MTNGMAHKCVPIIGTVAKIQLNPDAKPFMVQTRQLIRWYIVNGGPNDYVVFRFISSMLNCMGLSRELIWHTGLERRNVDNPARIRFGD